MLSPGCIMTVSGKIPFDVANELLSGVVAIRLGILATTFSLLRRFSLLMMMKAIPLRSFLKSWTFPSCKALKPFTPQVVESEGGRKFETFFRGWQHHEGFSSQTSLPSSSSSLIMYGTSHLLKFT